MTKYPLLLLVGIIALGVSSCQKDEDEMPVVLENLEGFWINPQYTGDTIMLSRAFIFVHDNYGISFRKGNQCTERKIAGECGTPPVVYANFDGTWAQTDSIIDIEVAFWGGMNNYKWKVIGLTDKHLEVKVLEHKSHYTE